MRSTPRHTRLATAALAAALAAAPALARNDCDAPVERWQAREAVRQMAAQKGWDVQRLKIDDGCYEIRGTDAQGRVIVGGDVSLVPGSNSYDGVKFARFLPQ